MPRATECLYAGRQLSIDDALVLRDTSRRNGKAVPQFTCLTCGLPVRPHHAGTHGAAHFEHRRRNPQCERSDPPR